MIRHVILWKLKQELSPTERESVKRGIKEGLEILVGQIEGLLSVRVETRGLPSSGVDLMLDSTFADEASLLRYAAHPLHVAVAEGKVRPYTAVRSCFDYEV